MTCPRSLHEVLEKSKYPVKKQKSYRNCHHLYLRQTRKILDRISVDFLPCSKISDHIGYRPIFMKLISAIGSESKNLYRLTIDGDTKGDSVWTYLEKRSNYLMDKDWIQYFYLPRLPSHMYNRTCSHVHPHSTITNNCASSATAVIPCLCLYTCLPYTIYTYLAWYMGKIHKISDHSIIEIVKFFDLVYSAFRPL